MKARSVETALKKLCKRKYVLLTGNATTSLFLSLKSLNLKPNSKIIIPNNSCPHVPLSVYLAGYSPLFTDIDKKNFGLSIKALKKNFTQKVKAVIAIHAYGIGCSIDQISKFCVSKSIPLIEDSALLLGTNIKTKPVGSFGNISVLSFGKGKVIDIGDGGALMTNDLETFNTVTKINDNLNIKIPYAKNQINKMNIAHTKIYNNYYLKNKKSIVRKKYMSKALKNAKFLLYKFDKKLLKKIIINKKRINKIKNKRIQNCLYLEKKLQKIKSNFFNIKRISKNSIPWRYNIFFLKENNRNFVLENLLKRRIKISSWHPRLDIFFEKNKKGNFPVTNSLDKSILNIWINNEVNKYYLDFVIKNISLLKAKLINL